MWCGFSVPSRTWQVDYERGFVDKVRLPLADFETQAEAIFRVEPVTSVILHFMMPKQVVVPKDQGRPSIAEVWIRMTSRPTRRTSNTNQLPEFLFDRLPGATGADQSEFPGDGSAAEALNQACIDFGRELAGLPHYTRRLRRIGE